jgi:hypothetical protein
MRDPVVFPSRSAFAVTCGIAESDERSEDGGFRLGRTWTFLCASFRRTNDYPQVHVVARPASLRGVFGCRSVSSAAERSWFENGYIPYRRHHFYRRFPHLPATNNTGTITPYPTTSPLLRRCHIPRSRNLNIYPPTLILIHPACSTFKLILPSSFPPVPIDMHE